MGSGPSDVNTSERNTLNAGMRHKDAVPKVFSQENNSIKSFKKNASMASINLPLVQIKGTLKGYNDTILVQQKTPCGCWPPVGC